MAEQKRNTRNSKSTKIQPVNDYGLGTGSHCIRVVALSEG